MVLYWSRDALVYGLGETAMLQQERESVRPKRGRDAVLGGMQGPPMGTAMS